MGDRNTVIQATSGNGVRRRRESREKFIDSLAASGAVEIRYKKACRDMGNYWRPVCGSSPNDRGNARRGRCRR